MSYPHTGLPNPNFRNKHFFVKNQELLSVTEQVDENVSYDLITIKIYDDLLGSCNFAQSRVRFQNFIFSWAEPKVFWSDLVQIRVRVCV
jgi:hypothetical protein